MKAMILASCPDRIFKHGHDCRNGRLNDPLDHLTDPNLGRRKFRLER